MFKKESQMIYFSIIDMQMIITIVSAIHSIFCDPVACEKTVL